MYIAMNIKKDENKNMINGHRPFLEAKFLVVNWLFVWFIQTKMTMPKDIKGNVWFTKRFYLKLKRHHLWKELWWPTHRSWYKERRKLTMGKVKVIVQLTCWIVIALKVIKDW